MRNLLLYQHGSLIAELFRRLTVFDKLAEATAVRAKQRLGNQAASQFSPYPVQIGRRLHQCRGNDRQPCCCKSGSGQVFVDSDFKRCRLVEYPPPLGCKSSQNVHAADDLLKRARGHAPDEQAVGQFHCLGKEPFFSVADQSRQFWPAYDLPDGPTATSLQQLGDMPAMRIPDQHNPRPVCHRGSASCRKRLLDHPRLNSSEASAATSVMIDQFNHRRSKERRIEGIEVSVGLLEQIAEWLPMSRRVAADN